MTISTNSPFFVSTDSVHYGSSITMGTGGGYFFVKYSPSTGIQRDSSSITLASGSTTTSIVLQGFTFVIDCQPINNLNISSSDLSHINIVWTEPQMDTTPQILTWNNAKTSNYSFNNNKVTLLQRFTTADLASHHNQTLTGISFYVTSGFSVLKLVVYKGSDFRGTSFNPGTLIVEETIPVSTLTGNSWNTFTLSHPVTIDAHEELCFGVYMESSYAYPIPVGSPIVAKKGSIVGYSNGSGGQSWSQINSYSVCLRGIIQNTQSVTHYEVSRDGTPLGSTTSTSYNDIVSHTDTYHYTVTAVWDNSCSSAAQMDFTNVASIIVNPQVLEFHNNYGYSNTVKTVQIGGNGISQPIQVSVSGNFQISTNGTSYSTSATLSSSGGVLYVKYTPTSTNTTFESGQIDLSSGALSARVSLTGQCYGDCNPPENLVLSASGPTANLHWDTPTYTPEEPAILSWCTTFIHGSFTFLNDGNCTMVQRFEPSDLTSYHNKKITSISFVMPNVSTISSGKIVVYKGGSFSSSGNPGTLVYEQNINISSLSDWTWNSITLNTPVTIDASQELWFGVYFVYSGTCYLVSCDNSVSVSKKGGLIKRNNYSWDSFDYGFSIKATVEDTPITVSRYQIDRNGSTIVSNTSATSYTDNVGVNGNYDYTVWAIWSNGCRAGASGSVSVTGGCTTPGSVTTQNLCGGTYTWHGTTYNASGTYTYAFTNGSGCLQVDTLRLNIHSNPSVTINGNSSICNGSSTTLTASGANTYSWNTGVSGASISVHPTSTATYTVTGTNSYGCTATATFTVNVTSPTLAIVSTSDVSSITTSTATCGGSVSSDACSPVTARGVCWSTSHNPTVAGSHTSNGTGTGTFTSNLTGLAENTTYYVRAYATTAAGTAYGTEKTFTTGCTPAQGIETVTACGSYTWHGHTYTASTNTPTYTITNGAANGCDSIVTLHLTIKPIPVVTISGNTHINRYESTTLTASGASSYVWSTGSHNNAITVSPVVTTTYSVTGTTDGCSSTPASVTVTVGDCIPFYHIETVTACNSYTWHGHTYTESTNTPTHTFPNGASNGCDSIVNLHLIIIHSTNNSIYINECGSYTWYGTTYTTSGTYTHEYSSHYGCTQVDTLHLTITPIPVVTISGDTSIFIHESTIIMASGAESYIWSNGLNSTGFVVSPTTTTTYTVTGYNNLCASEPVSITVHVKECIPAQGIETITACSSYTWHGHTYTASTNTATYTIPSGAANGCDSIVTLHLTIHKPAHNAITVSECGRYTWSSGNGQTYTQSGTYLHTHTDVNGCTQVDTLHLTINPIPLVTITGNTSIPLYESTTLTAHGATSYTWSNGSHASAITVSPASATTYSVTGTTNGCTGTPASVTVVVGPCQPKQGVETVTACGSYTWHGHTYTASTNTPTYTIPGGAATGCDSVVTLHLTIKPVPVVTVTGNIAILIDQSTTLTAHGASSYTWSNGSHASAITVSPASTTTYSVVGTLGGCTSAPASVTVNVSACLPGQHEETITACDSYTWTSGNGQTYNESTNVTHTIPNGAANGCDSILTLHLIVRHPAKEYTVVTGCGSYTWNGIIYTQSGTYTFNHTDNYGCILRDTLVLTIKPKPVVTVTGNTSILASQSTTLTAQGAISYVWSNGSQTNTITVSPTDTTIYTVVGTTDGCSSEPVRVTVNVSPCTPVQGVETVTACDSYTWHGTTYTESTNTATYTIPGGAANGCDSIVTLHLTVRHPENEYSVITECGNFTWNGTTYTQSGTYTYSHTDSYGCTQMDTLVLTITPIPVVTITGNSSINLNESTTLTIHADFHHHLHRARHLQRLHQRAGQLHRQRNRLFTRAKCGNSLCLRQLHLAWAHLLRKH